METCGGSNIIPDASVAAVKSTDEGCAPALRPIAEKIRDEQIADNNGIAIDENDDENDEFSSRPTKIFKFAIGVAIAKQVRNVNDDDKKINKTVLLSKQELRTELFKVLKKFLKAAFTIIVKKKNLSPHEAFGTTRVLGVNVPKFIHPSSLEYVEEVAKKLILFLHRNSSEGCAMHVMIEKNKTLHVVQRFVFRTMGSLDLPDISDIPNGNDDSEEMPLIDIDEFKAHCRTSLLKLLNSDAIKPMIAPQYSRWSISIGLKPEFIADGEIEELWSNDPSGNYFPWKRRPRNVDVTTSIHKNDSTALKISSALPANCCNGSTNYLQQKGEKETTDNLGANCKLSINKESPACKEKDPVQLIDTSRESTVQLNNTTSDHFPNNEANKIVCFPLSSFPITSNFMLSIYGLDYPAPINTVIVHQSSVFSPRVVRSSSHHYPRLPHFKSRHRILRQSSNKF